MENIVGRIFKTHILIELAWRLPNLFNVTMNENKCVERVGCFAYFVSLVSHDCCVVLSCRAIGLSAVCDCGIS